METQVYATTIRAGGQSVVGESTTYEADLQHNINNTLAAGATSTESVDVDVSAIESFYIYSDKDITVQPMASASRTADGPFTIPAKKAMWWNTGRVENNPLTADFDGLRFHNPGTGVATIKAGFLVHAVS